MLWRLGIADARARYARGVTTPTEVLNSILQRVDATNPTINAFATLDVEGARVAAAESDRRYERGESRGPLDGAVLTVKEDRKSTRLNSSHLVNSYAVFCLKKKITDLYIAICTLT